MAQTTLERAAVKRSTHLRFTLPAAVHAAFLSGKRAPLVIHDLTIYMWHTYPCGHESHDGETNAVECSHSIEAARACSRSSTRDGSGVRIRMCAFVAASGEPVADYGYRNEAARDAAIVRLMQSARARAKQKNERKVERAALPARPVQVGDVFVRSWGYDQTNVDFYVVTSVTPSGKSCTVHKCGKVKGDGRDMVKADPTSTRLAAPRERTCRISVGYRGVAQITTGRGDHASLDTGESHYETNPYEGH